VDAYGLEEVSMDLPIGIVSTYVAYILIYEMGRIADYLVPNFRAWDALKVVRLINGNAVTEFVHAHGVLARRDRCWVNVGQAKGFTKDVS
jgi:hypothetical protein